jgi:glycosyltransferase involved in cell wall biosynthesis
MPFAETEKKTGSKKIAYKSFYRLLRWVSELEIPLDSGDFCLMDRKVADVIIHQIPENIRFIRGLRTFAGFKQTGIFIERGKRAAGKSKYRLKALTRLAFDGIFGFSLMPLRIASYMGLIIAIPSFLIGIFFIIHRIFNFKLLGYSPTDTPGLASLATGIFFLGGVTLIILGIIGEYLGRIYLEVKRRPGFIVEEVKKP